MTAGDTAQMPLPKSRPGYPRRRTTKLGRDRGHSSYEHQRAKAAGPHDGTTLSRIEDVSITLASS